MRLRAHSFAAPALALLSALVLAGCPARLQYPECKVDPDCKDHGQVCVTGFCRQCREDAQCKAGELCKDNGCLAKPECAETKDCPAGQRCAAGKCAPECSEATAETDCGKGRKCNAGRCAAEEECVADADCSDGRACVAGLCKAQGGVMNSSLQSRLGDCEVKAVYFDFDEATLSKDSTSAIAENWKCLSAGGFKKLVLSGHTDERGTTEYNLALGSRRAEAVRKYLQGLGAEARKLRAVSFGEEKPVDSGQRRDGVGEEPPRGVRGRAVTCGRGGPPGCEERRE